ncbi:MAG: hypothetical protein J6W27_01405, partial [Alphaproteobacteria bacterium]|nr:hypothetical protein [Alphaproteobacteria bacterium]
FMHGNDGIEPTGSGRSASEVKGARNIYVVGIYIPIRATRNKKHPFGCFLFMHGNDGIEPTGSGRSASEVKGARNIYVVGIYIPIRATRKQVNFGNDSAPKLLRFPRRHLCRGK